MIAEESVNQRKLIGSLDEGKEVVEELTRICELQKVESAEISLIGRIRDPDVAYLIGKEYVSAQLASGVYDLVRINGNVARMGDNVVLRIESLLAAPGPMGQQMVFGQLRSAEIVECEFSLTIHEDLVSTRRFDAETGMLRLASIERKGESKPPKRDRGAPVERIAEPKLTAEPDEADEPDKPAKAEAPPEKKAKPVSAESVDEESMTWDQAAEAAKDVKPASKRRSKKSDGPNFDEYLSEDEDDLALMSPGDILDHPKLGQCRVIKVEDEEYAHIRLKRGQIRKLALEVCEIHFEGEEDGRNLFSVRIKR